MTTRDVIAIGFEASGSTSSAGSRSPASRRSVRPRDLGRYGGRRRRRADRERSGWSSTPARDLAEARRSSRRAGPSGFALCPGETASSRPGATTSRSDPQQTGRYGARCRGDLVDADGASAARARRALGDRAQALGRRRAVRGGRARMRAVGHFEYPDVGVAFEIADVDRDGTPEVIFAGAGAPGDPDTREGRVARRTTTKKPRGSRSLHRGRRRRHRGRRPRWRRRRRGHRGGAARRRDARRSVEARVKAACDRSPRWLGATLAHAETRPRYGGTVEATLLGAPASLDPVPARTHAEVDGRRPRVRHAVSHRCRRRVAAARRRRTCRCSTRSTTTVRIAIKKGIRLHDGTRADAAGRRRSRSSARAARRRWLLAAGRRRSAPMAMASSSTLRAPAAELTTLLALPQTRDHEGGQGARRRPIGSGPFSSTSIDRARHRAAAARVRRSLRRPAVPRSSSCCAGTTRPTARRAGSRPATRSSRRAASRRSRAASRRFAAVDVEGPAALLLFVGFGRAHADVTADRAFRQALDLALGRGGLDGDRLGRARRRRRGRRCRSRRAAPRSMRRAGVAMLDAARAQLAERPSASPRSARSRADARDPRRGHAPRRSRDRRARVSRLDKLGIQAVDHGGAGARRCAIASRTGSAICGSASSPSRSTRAGRVVGARRSPRAATTGSLQAGRGRSSGDGARGIRASGCRSCR